MWINTMLARFFTLVACIGIVGVALSQLCRGGAIGGIGDGTVVYSPNNDETEPWATNLSLGSPSHSWYSRLQIDTDRYSGSATIVWQLQQKNGAVSWTNVLGARIITSVVFSEGVQNIYASSNGSHAAGNHDWGLDVATMGTYRVVATVEYNQLLN